MLPDTAPRPAANDALIAHPMDSSRILSALLQLVQAATDCSGQSPIDSIIPTGVLRQMLTALYFRDIETLKHSRRVGLLSVGIGTRLGWEDNELRLIEVASLLHDIGKVGIPDHILKKPGKLSPDEAEYIASHHRVAVELLRASRADAELINIVAQSHGVDSHSLQPQESETCLGARILAVADAFEALTSPKPYRDAFHRDEALTILHEQSGKGFDRNIVAALDRWLKSPEADILEDDAAAEAAIMANAPTTQNHQVHAALFCQLFQHLHLLESLYDAFYVVNRERQIVAWSTGASRLFGYPAEDMIGQAWHRSIVGSPGLKPEPVEVALSENRSLCHSLTLKDLQGSSREFNVQTVPIVNQEGYVDAVVELICDGNQSKKHRVQFRKLQMAATRDALTGVLNRGELYEQLNQVFGRWEEEPTIPFSLVFLDIDHFKAINDRLSHAVGDRVLVDVARLVQDELYSGEIVGRYGGEEFIILCPETPLEAAIDRAERLRRVIMSSKIANREDLRVTASFGVAQIEPGDTQESIVKRADQALYDAKNSGRNRTCHRVTRRATQVSPGETASTRNQWVHRSEIVTCVATSMLPIKLKGYVIDNHARITDVQAEELTLQVGSPSLLGGWGNKPEKQPVRVNIKIQDLPRDEKVAGTRRVLLKTQTEPIGKPSKAETFQSRAMYVIESLRSYLIAD